MVQHVTLRPPIPGDMAAKAAFGISSEIHRMSGGHPDQIPAVSESVLRTWFEWLESQRWARVILADGQAVGEIRLHRFSDPTHSASLAVGLWSETHLSQGIGRRAIQLCLDEAFELMELHRIEMRILSFNARAIRCCAASGFTHEGILRDAVRIGDTCEDEHIKAILAPDYKTFGF